jgi:hypothetical protein
MKAFIITFVAICAFSIAGVAIAGNPGPYQNHTCQGGHNCNGGDGGNGGNGGNGGDGGNVNFHPKTNVKNTNTNTNRTNVRTNVKTNVRNTIHTETHQKQGQQQGQKQGQGQGQLQGQQANNEGINISVAGDNVEAPDMSKLPGTPGDVFLGACGARGVSGSMPGAGVSLGATHPACLHLDMAIVAYKYKVLAPDGVTPMGDIYLKEAHGLLLRDRWYQRIFSWLPLVGPLL